MFLSEKPSIYPENSNMFRIILALAVCASAAIDLRGVELYSNNSEHFGRWEIRMKAAATPGSVSSFFTYHNDSWRGSPHPWREIDIEVLGNKPQQFQSNLITGIASKKVTSEDYHTNGSDLSNSYHTYTLDWTPDSIVWRLDGQTVRKTAAPDKQVTDLRDSAHTYRMNLWASTSTAWVGRLDTTKLPVLQIIRWMRFYDYKPGSGDKGSNFKLAWVDSFKTFDRSRWSLGDWTFEENYATFSKSNCHVRDGHLIMMLSTAANEGQFPATFPHDTEGSSSVSPRGVSSNGNYLNPIGRGVWASSASFPLLEAYDLGGRLVARGKPSAEGQTIDLAKFASSLLLIRQGSLAARMAPGTKGDIVLR